MAVTRGYCLSVSCEFKQKPRKLEKDNIVSQRIFTLCRNSSKRKEASCIEFGSGTSYTRKPHFSVEELLCYFEVGMGWKLGYILLLA